MAHPWRFAGAFTAGAAFGLLAFFPHGGMPAAIVIPHQRLTPAPWVEPSEDDAAMLQRMLRRPSYPFTPTHFERFEK